MNRISVKHIWETIEIIIEGTKEVKENRLDIVTYKYEAFKSLPEDGILKFMITLPQHLKDKVSIIREANHMSKISLNKMYGKLKTYKLKIEQRKEFYDIKKSIK